MPLHIAIAVTSGVLFLAYIRRLSVRGLMSMRYTMGWFVIGLSAIFLAPLIGLAHIVADAVGTQTSVILLGLPLVVLCLVAVQLSITVSGLTERTRSLAEEVAILRAVSEASRARQSPEDPHEQTPDLDHD